MGLSETLSSYFDVDDHGSDVRTEVLAGITTFLAMSYIIVVNPAILSYAILWDHGAGERADTAVIDGATYTATEVFQMLAIVTILASIAAIVVMAFYAKRPFGLAPGMGLNAFFAFSVVVGFGIPWQTALAAVFVEGVIFILLTAVGARKYIISLFPEPVKFAVGAGIGVFLLFIGLQEMQIVVGDPETLVRLGDLFTNPVAIVALAGLILTLVLWARGVTGSIVIGILGTAAVGWIVALAGLVERGTLVDAQLLERTQTEGFLSVLMDVQWDITPLAGAFVDGFTHVEPITFAFVVFTFFFVDFFDTAGTLIGVSQFGGFLDEEGDLPEMDKPLMADAIGTTVGSMLGTSTVTTYIESSTGIEEGGRTGLTALVVGGLFLLAIPLVSLASIVPDYASFIALVVVGIIMFQGVTDIDWSDPAWTVSAVLTITIMPLTYSIADGLAAGIIAYPIVKLAMGEGRDVVPGQYAIAAVLALYYVLQTGGFIL
ncbi:NCS2 family permease [Halalkaliarchaeum sp. AArc-GB]|uniref:NCS2 family permease n=1 Tax=Halalkaliarchaeum sp. AArc-GB TaxID=3074078 RepID=UPI002857E7CE|nr:NCS2 family permease [Halalkaliarchaeum sp. AArc-GB]MDR5674456.1 NCS2 family permease [Halalkaliarchaeum sp. AArc-GB]